MSPRAPKECGKPGCDERVRGRRYCAQHTVAWEGSTRSGTHTSAADQRLRAQVLVEEPFCACGALATEAGHIRPHAYGGAYVRENLRGQCTACNRKQIAEDRAKYGVV